MYNILHGKNPNSEILLAILGLKMSDVGRFRDAWITEDGEIAVYTRNGGGNREHWSDDGEEGIDCDCTGCIITYKLPKHPLYIRDEDDDFDCTYATIYFKVPKEIESKIEEMKGQQNTEYSKMPTQRFFELLDNIKQMSKEQLEAEFPEITSVLQKVSDSVEKSD